MLKYHRYQNLCQPLEMIFGEKNSEMGAVYEARHFQGFGENPGFDRKLILSGDRLSNSQTTLGGF
jgi:hypothetical protein